MEVIKTHAVHIQNVSKHLKDLCPTSGYVRDLAFHHMLYTVLCSLVDGYILSMSPVADISMETMVFSLWFQEKDHFSLWEEIAGIHHCINMIFT